MKAVTYSFTSVFLGLCTAIVSIGCLVLFAFTFLSFAGLTTQGKVTFEVPISMASVNNPENVTNKDENYIATRIEYDSVALEVAPTKNINLMQGIMYLYGFLFCLIIFGIFYLLFQITMSAQTNPFQHKNVFRIRRIGLLSLGLEGYRFISSFIISSSFKDKFEVIDAEVVSIGFKDLNIVLLLFGLVMLVFAEIFSRGSILQEYENQTV